MPPLFSSEPAADGPADPRRPIWLLDVDGVLNAVTLWPDRNRWDDWRSGRATANGREWGITWSETVVATVRRLHQERLVDIWWLTTWRAQANDSLRDLLGLPAFPVVPDESDTAAGTGTSASHGGAYGSGAADATGEWWKLTAARRLLDGLGTRPVIWTDDDLAHEPAAYEWAASTGSDSLLIAPDSGTGLIAADLAELEEFCRLAISGQAP